MNFFIDSRQEKKEHEKREEEKEEKEWDAN